MASQGRYFIFLIIIASVLFGVLAIFAKRSDYFWFDLVLTRDIQEFNPTWFDFLMRFLTNAAYLPWSIITLGLTCLLIFYLRKKIEASILIFSVLGVNALSETLKNIVSRPRPSPDLVNQITQHVRSDSFPSGHVLVYISFLGVLLFYSFTLLKKSFFRNILVGIFLALIFLIGVSRIYLGDHWFSDVLGSYLIGFIWLNFIIFLYKIVKKRF